MKVAINMNEYVKVKLTQHGIDVLSKSWDELLQNFPKAGEFNPPQVDSDGYSRFQLWELFSKFGREISLGRENCFDLEIVFEK